MMLKMNLKIKDILKATNGILLSGDLEYECENFSKDTRKIKKGDTYLAIKGESFDGNLFWKDALNNGADTVIIEKDIGKEDLKKYKNKNIIKVEDTKKALIQIATAKRNLYKDLIVVGVTGSVGKTSTKDIIANVLSQKYNTLKTEGNMNNAIGLPFTILNLRNHEALVIEMGMNHFGEIRELTNIAKPTLAVITNIGTSHIGNLGSRENILNAKLEILEGMEKKKVIINNDNDLLHKWKNDNNNMEIYTFGIENKSDCNALKITKKENSSEFICKINEEKFNIKVPVGGEVFILNALCASLVGKLLNLSNNEIQEGIESFELTKKRMEIIKLKNGVTLINDSYNASFDSMKAGIEYLSETTGKRKIAVLGDMFELGTFSEELHRKVGAEVAKNNIDILFAIGENSKYIVDETEKDGMNKEKIFYLQDKKELLEKIIQNMQSGDVIFFKASNGMRLFEIVDQLRTEFFN